MKTREQIEARLNQIVKKINEVRFELEREKDKRAIYALNRVLSELLKQSLALQWVLND